jgi:predicted ABC-type transport system involved in lysophospholipase L1 biosynthesis ATPase subunit
MFLEVRDLKKSFGEGQNKVDVLKGIDFVYNQKDSFGGGFEKCGIERKEILCLW